ncbi:prolyl aminopeptidase [Cupriavidus sp. USMAHM13]|uniref:alpha/beta fold hydrolase n=1 Tax=Cupriavidus sp. USMAHM13 TaxID=1389192 RepID=UPI0008A6F6C0|nr:alpha/beta fold hydrolase [Cupriavidus sp. USMAHM13]AOZ03034.1 prolyl aminopeptidase [Cupriavidus sp. USMAHM13]
MPNTPSPPSGEVFWLRTPDAHRLHVRLLGPPGGTPWLVLHGGPGSGCAPSMADWFDLARHRVVLPDQRGAGRSRPAGSLRRNTTGALLDDLERLRRALGIERWHVAAGSWGAALALAYAARHAPHVAGLVLRGSFLTGRDDILRLFSARARGASMLAPRAHAAAHTRLGAAQAQLLATVQLLQNGTPVQQRDTAWRWRRVEAGLLAGRPARRSDGADRAGARSLAARRAERALCRKYRIQARYLPRRCGLGKAALLRAAAAVGAQGIPVTLLHGTRDRVCPPRNAERLRRAIPQAELWRIAGGHLAQGAMAEALGRAIRRQSA